MDRIINFSLLVAHGKGKLRTTNYPRQLDYSYEFGWRKGRGMYNVVCRSTAKFINKTGGKDQANCDVLTIV